MPTFPDLQTVFLVCCIANLVPSLGLFVVHATNRTYPGFRQWALASTFAFVATALLAAYSLLPNELTVILINLTFFAWPLLLARGFRNFAGRPPQDWILPAVEAVVLFIALFFTYVQPDANVRVFTLSVLLIFLFADCALLVRGVKQFAHPAVKASLIGAFSLLSAWNILRVPLIIGLWSGWSPTPAQIQCGTLITLTAVNIGISLGVVVLNFAQASESLRESEERFRQAMQHSPIGMSLVTLDGRWIEVNPALCRIVGRPREELIGATFQSITYPEDRPADAELIRGLVNRQVPSYRREKRYVHRDGRLIWVQVDVSIIFQPDGTPQHLVAQIVDVTERKRTELALQGYQARLVLAMDIARLGLWECDLATGLFTFDENFYKLLGTSVAREGGLTMSAETYARRFVVPEEQGVVPEEIRKAQATGDPNYQRQLEYRFRRADGTLGLMSVRFAIEKDVTGRTVRAFGLKQDITEQAQAAQHRRALEEQLRHAQKMEALGALAGGIAHDFNNILTGIMGNLQLAELELSTDHPVQARLSEAGRASRRARDNVARILTFSRRYQGDRALAALGPIVQEAVELLRASLPATIEIRTAIAPDCPPVVCDSTQIHQVVMNLGTNSAYAMRHTSGVLEVELKTVTPDRQLLEQHPQVKAHHRVRLAIRDTGCGMDEAVLQRIFEPFFTTKNPGEGTGLGLAMVHGIVEDHLGAIVVQSTVGHGTSFEIYFPVVPGTSSASPQADSRPPEAIVPFGQGRRIMLVDDDEAVLNLGRSILTRYGFVPEPFSSPAVALAKFQAAPQDYAAVISDLTMPGMTGVELARRIHALRPGCPIVLASGYLDETAHSRARESGVTHFVTKPFELEEFMGKLRAALDEGRPA